MKKIVLIGLIVLLLLSVVVGGAVAQQKVIIIPGWGHETEGLNYLKDRIENAEIIGYSHSMPISDAAEEVYEKIIFSNKKVSIVGFSWGGLIARQIAAVHPEIVDKLIIIASPSGGYLFSPKFLFKVAKSEKAIFVIAGTKSAKKWYLKEVNDGKVDLDSVFSETLSIREVKIFELSHEELSQNEEVVSQVNVWLKK